MITYYKYTDGEAFTLNNVDYVGFFNVIDGKAYTGIKKTITSEELTPKENFISEIYLKQLEFDSNYNINIDLLPISQEKFDIFTLTNLKNIIDILNLNNLKIYKSLVLQNVSFIDLSLGTNHYYGLSSTYSDIRTPDDELYGKTDYVQIDPFEYNGDWSFLDEIKTGSIIVNNKEDFYYYCTDNISAYVLEGSFSNPSKKLSLIGETDYTERVLSIFVDDVDLNIFEFKKDAITIYEYEPFANCGTLLKKDKISLQDNLLFIKIGSSIRLEITSTDLYIKNKYSNDIFYKVSVNSLNLGNILNCEVRKVDDLIVIVSYDNKNNKFYVTYIDPEFPNEIINQVEMLYFNNSSFTLSFSNIDSNVIIFNFKEYTELRFISNSKYPAGNNSKNKKSITKNFKYLKNYRWNDKELYYNLSNVIKWNSNSLKSNSYNNILTESKNFNNTTYNLIHNIGRIYVSKQPINEFFKLFKIPKNLPKAFSNIECSNSSFGLYLNNSLKNIVTDIISIFVNCECNVEVSKDGSTINISELENIKISIENMFFNGNEQLNVSTLNRIFETIIEIQRKLINN